MLNVAAAGKMPFLGWSIAEPFRAAADFWTSMASWAPPSRLGDGHPVLVVPGFTADDGATVMLRSFLTRSGFDAHAWQLGTNVGSTSAGDRLAERVAEIARATERKVSIVGWSLGGLMARDVAKFHPHLVRQVIGLGSPLAGEGAADTRSCSRPTATHSQAAALQSAWESLPVPYTSIYSRSDGVVGWRECAHPSRNQTESIEVNSSHWGLVNNPDVQAVIAERLAQAEGSWSPFRRGTA